MSETFAGPNLLTGVTVLFAVASAVVILWYLLARPPLLPGTKMALFGGIFVLPITAALSGNVAGYETTKTREFCAGCHVMVPYTDDADDSTSTTLASIHGRNRVFGDNNCYECHADYGIYGSVATKVDGVKHAWHYYASYASMPIPEALQKIELYKPYANRNCTKCHSMRLPDFFVLEDHRGVEEELQAGEASCASKGCHGPAHPFSKAAKGEAP